MILKFLKYYITIIVFIIASFSFLSVMSFKSLAQFQSLPEPTETTEPIEPLDNESDNIIIKAEKIISNAAKNKNPEVLRLAAEFVAQDEFSSIIDSVVSGNKIGNKMILLEYAQKDESEYCEYIFESLMSDRVYAVRDFALYTCGLIKNPVLLDEAREAIEDKDYYIRVRAVWYLAQINDNKSLNNIEGRIANETGWRALKFAQSAFILGSDNAESYLKSKALDGKNVKIQSYALSMLLEAGDTSAIEPLIKLTNNFDDRASAIAFEALAKYLPEDSPALPYVIAKGDVPSIKIVLKRLANFNNAVPLLNRAINLTEARRAEFFASIISKAKSNEFFLNVLASDDIYIKEIIPEGLMLAVSIDKENGQTIVKNILKTSIKNEKIITVCIDILGNYGNTEDLQILEKYLEYDDNIAINSATAILKIVNRDNNLN